MLKEEPDVSELGEELDRGRNGCFQPPPVGELGDTHKPESILPSLTLINFEHFCIIGSGYLLLFQINQ